MWAESNSLSPVHQDTQDSILEPHDKGDKQLSTFPLHGPRASFPSSPSAALGVGELSVFCQSYFNNTLIGQAGSIGGKARQKVEVEQRDWEYSGKQEAPSPFLPRPPERKDVSCPTGKGTEPCG